MYFFNVTGNVLALLPSVAVTSLKVCPPILKLESATMAKKATNKKAAKQLTTMNETGRRAKAEDRRKEEAPTSADRRKTSRRRQIDPTTCERDYTDCEIEFMHALDDYKRTSGRMFPTCSEILEVLGKLGYRKLDMPADAGMQNEFNEDTEGDIGDVEELEEIETIV